MSVQDNWAANLNQLVARLAADAGGDRRHAYRTIADEAGLSEEYIYQLCEGKPKADGSERVMGLKAARAIGRAFGQGRPADWFDMPSDGDSTPGPSTILEDVSLSEVLQHAPPEERRRVLDDIRMTLVRARAKYTGGQLERLLDTLDAIDSRAARSDGKRQ